MQQPTLALTPTPSGIVAAFDLVDAQPALAVASIRLHVARMRARGDVPQRVHLTMTGNVPDQFAWEVEGACEKLFGDVTVTRQTHAGLTHVRVEARA